MNAQAEAVRAEVVDGHCRAVTQDGRPCLARPAAGSAFCFMHDPAQAVARQEARRKGGRNRRRVQSDGTATAVDLRSPQAITELLEAALGDLLALENSIQRARTVGSIAAVALKALEVGELEERLEAVELAMKSGSDRR